MSIDNDQNLRIHNLEKQVASLQRESGENSTIIKIMGEQFKEIRRDQVEIRDSFVPYMNLQMQQEKKKEQRRKAFMALVGSSGLASVANLILEFLGGN